MNKLLDIYPQFEWLTKGITAKTANYEQSLQASNNKPIDYQDRLGVIATMKTDLEKAITTVIIYDGKAKNAYEMTQLFLANIMITQAEIDKKRNPEHLTIEHLALLIARLVIDFTLNPNLDDYHTALGRLYYMGIGSNQMSLKAYDGTWKKYEKEMKAQLDKAIEEAAFKIDLYKKNTYKENAVQC